MTNETTKPVFRSSRSEASAPEEKANRRKRALTARQKAIKALVATGKSEAEAIALLDNPPSGTARTCTTDTHIY